MQILLSTTGTPYIELEGGDKLIFSKATADPVKGFKYLCYSGKSTSTVCISGSRAKNKKYSKIVENVNFSVRLSDFKRPTSNPKGFPKGIMPKITLGYFKKEISKLLDKDGYLPFDMVPVLNDTLSQMDRNDMVDDDPEATEVKESDLKPVSKKKIKTTVKSRPRKNVITSKIKIKKK